MWDRKNLNLFYNFTKTRRSRKKKWQAFTVLTKNESNAKRNMNKKTYSCFSLINRDFFFFILTYIKTNIYILYIKNNRLKIFYFNFRILYGFLAFIHLRFNEKINQKLRLLVFLAFALVLIYLYHCYSISLKNKKYKTQKIYCKQIRSIFFTIYYSST